MPSFFPRPYLNSFRFVMVGVIAIGAVLMVATTYRWPLQWDAQVMHYINFLMDRGFAPYRDITDMNMPGAYLTEGWAMHLFGGGDLGWRIYDFTLLGLLTLSMAVIALPYDWVAGLFAGVMFALVHTAEGPSNTAQRDEAMTMLIMAGYALLFEAVRRRKPWLLFFFGLCVGMASSIKPMAAPLGAVLLGMAWWTLRKRGLRTASYLWCGMAGAAVAAAIVVGFLLRYDAVGPFLDISKRITTYYAGSNHRSLAQMVRLSLPRVAVLMFPIAVVAAVANNAWRNWERWAVLLGVAFGAASFFGQFKGYAYHRYTLVAFILLWMGIELSLAMRRQDWVKWIGVVGMALGALTMVPVYTNRVLQIHPESLLTEALVKDLTQLGGDQLQRKVQCLDLVDGCLNALYRLKLVQSTGSMGDILLFAPDHAPTVEYYRNIFWNEMNGSPPSVIVLTDEWYQGARGFNNKLNHWPDMADFLARNYTLAASRRFASRIYLMEEPNSYRIYVRKGLTLPPLENARSASSGG